MAEKEKEKTLKETNERIDKLEKELEKSMVAFNIFVNAFNDMLKNPAVESQASKIATISKHDDGHIMKGFKFHARD